MSGPVDVLAVMRAAIDGLPDTSAAPLAEAYKTVAELIGATTAYSRSVRSKPVVVQMARLHRLRAALANADQQP